MLIVATYESVEVADRFIEGTLMPLMPIQGGLVGPPEERRGQSLDRWLVAEGQSGCLGRRAASEQLDSESRADARPHLS